MRGAAAAWTATCLQPNGRRRGGARRQPGPNAEKAVSGDREDAGARWRGGGEGGGHGGQPAAGGDEMELGEPGAGGVRDLGALVQARPDAHQPVLAGGRTRDPALPAQVGDVDELAAGQRVGGGHRQVQGAFGKCLQRERGRLDVRRAEGRRGRQ
ncbi:hypothetical protein SSPO_099990 [Streptomyces antimycoticus]|uniref:Uncharacterized protein n=1 Tax=Streptomyces antimycoticus TaxID=68175 RepID=A0A499VCN5_9ACTN|nr:hypothetical protein SSPO_099990 [Streptomyces antimycoticus]